MFETTCNLETYLASAMATFFSVPFRKKNVIMHQLKPKKNMFEGKRSIFFSSKGKNVLGSMIRTLYRKTQNEIDVQQKLRYNKYHNKIR